MSWFETAEQRRKRLEREAAQKASVSYASPSQSTTGDDGFAFGLATGDLVDRAFREEFVELNVSHVE